MKVLTQILTVFIAINLITANTTLAQNPTEEEFRQVQQTLAQKQQELAKQQVDLLMKAADAEDAAMQANIQADLSLQQQKVSLASAYGGLGMDRILMVLTGQMKAQDIAATTEDLNIMSRIFDKKLGSAYIGLQIHTSAHHYPDIAGLLHSLRRRDGSKGTQAIYLHGYAALFLMNVDFPLSAPPEVEVEKIEKDVDPVWEGTKQEISTLGKTREQDYLYVEHDSAKEYDAEKVEDLKTNLTKALRHAANIRNLNPDDSIILAVAGTQPAIGGPAVIGEVAVEGKKTRRVITNLRTSTLFTPALLTIRAKKSDIDAYAKGELDLDQFRARVQFLTSHVSLAPVRAEQLQWRDRY